jgi:putative ABC transport system permease protein
LLGRLYIHRSIEKAVAVYGAIFAATKIIVKTRTGVALNVWQMDVMLWRTPLLTPAVGALAGLIPAFKAYQTDVA